ncbi:hypothetical protein NWFMUON74_50360 [Nocardia wallacei]|uniref:Uncharacterized protein n=2 Tax=Nocardia wallacei TaxID=480035 RepID=A0A7G1KVU9_9NOCA|nr:hypothetical protein [Nocardia wallacei]BCK57264.1 hypothetical protein NWFMUON74_50360 [Nocardia wallacei]
MTLSHLICQYCSHRNSGADSRCAHCGAPLSAAAHPGHAGHPGAPEHAEHPAGQQFSTMTGRLLNGAEHAAADVAKTAEGAGKEVASDAAKIITERLASMSWRTAVAILVAMVILAIVVMRSCSGSAPDLSSVGGLGGADGVLGGGSSSAEALPEPLRGAAKCRSADPSGASESCVVEANSALLSGGITGGRALTVSVQREQPNRVADTIARWRAAGATTVADGTVFAAVGPSSTVMYADSRSGLRLETGAFTDRSGARTFLQRSGLLR